MILPSSSGRADARGSIPVRAGIGLKAQHYAHILADRPDVGWLELHSENYLDQGGPSHRYLEAIAELYPLSFHGVGLSLGSADPLDDLHLEAVARLVARYRPALVSEHLSWSIIDKTYLNDLIPLPYTDETLAVMTDHVQQFQDRLGRQVLIENPSAYLAFAHSPIPETEFLLELCRRTGCGVLLDVNNVYVSANNLGFSAEAYVAALAEAPVGEIHLAGHARRTIEGHTLLIDDHGSRVSDAVWQLYARTLDLLGPCPTLMEWDTAVPDLDVWVDEAARADHIIGHASSPARAKPEVAHAVAP